MVATSCIVTHSLIRSPISQIDLRVRDYPRVGRSCFDGDQPPGGLPWCYASRKAEVDQVLEKCSDEFRVGRETRLDGPEVEPLLASLYHNLLEACFPRRHAVL